MTRGLDQCLFVYPVKTWGIARGEVKVLMPIEAGTRGRSSGSADDACQRRLIRKWIVRGVYRYRTISKEYAGLSKDVVVAGLWNRLEVWDESKWKHYRLSS